MGDALMYEAKKADLKEFYSIGLELGADHPSVLAGEPLRGPTTGRPSCPSSQRDFTLTMRPSALAAPACWKWWLSVFALERISFRLAIPCRCSGLR